MDVEFHVSFITIIVVPTSGPNSEHQHINPHPIRQPIQVYLASMFSLLLTIFLAQTVRGRCTISGTSCSFQSVANEDQTVSGICVPLDSSGVSQDCNNIYGFIVDNTQCEGYDANVRHLTGGVTNPSRHVAASRSLVLTLPTVMAIVVLPSKSLCSLVPLHRAAMGGYLLRTQRVMSLTVCPLSQCQLTNLMWDVCGHSVGTFHSASRIDSEVSMK
jgi:hypothetical protein